MSDPPANPVLSIWTRARDRRGRLGSSHRPTVASNPATTTASASASNANGGRPPNHHDSGQCRSCVTRPSMRPPRLRPLTRLPTAAVCPTTTPSACAFAVTVHSGRPSNHHDSGLRRDCPQRPSAQPPRLRPVQGSLNTAVCATTTASASAATADHGRPHNHHDLSLCRCCR